MFFFIFYIVLTASSAFATPDILEVWFVDKKKTSSLFELEKERVFAQNSYQCVRVGENCFDPQIGLYDPKLLEESDKIAIPKMEYEDEWSDLSKEVGGNGDLTTLDFIKKGGHKCDGTNYFDVFCGNPKKIKNKGPVLDIYIDITESMGRIDGKDLDGDCYRASLVRRVRQDCDSQARFYVYNHSRWEIDDAAKACQSNYIADDSRLMRWIKSSKAKKLVIITERSEVGKKFLDFARSLRAVFKGELNSINISSLPNKFTEFSKTCSK